jgi:hypothetical protein
MNDTDTDRWSIGLAIVVADALDRAGAKPDPDPRRNPTTVRVGEDGVITASVPIILDTDDDARLDVSVDRASLREAVDAATMASTN